MKDEVINKIVKIIDNNCVYPTYPEFIYEHFPQYAHLYIENKFPKFGDKLVALGYAEDEIGEIIYLVKSTDEFVFLIDKEGFEVVSLKDCLKPGLVVELRDKSQFFINNQMELISMKDNRDWDMTLLYDKDLYHIRERDFDIVKIYNGRNCVFWERTKADWDNISVGEDVWVRNDINDKWTSRMFVRAITGLDNPIFQVINKETRQIEHWNYCKLKNS